MKWILIIITWMNPYLPVTTLELVVRTEQECLQDKARMEQGFAKVDGLEYIIECVPVDPNDRMKQTKADYSVFVDECYYLGGALSIDRPFYERRVQGAPVTVWEMRDAVCTYPGYQPLRMYY